eukprot:s348_g3.t1
MEQSTTAACRPTVEVGCTREQAITVYALRDGDINMNHLVRHYYHKDVPYYMLEFILVWPIAQGLEHLYCKHFFACDSQLYAADLPSGWGGLSVVPTILHRVNVYCTGFKFYPFQQHAMLVHASGATISGSNTGETNRLAWHVSYHEAEALDVKTINDRIHFEMEMTTLERRTIPYPTAIPPALVTNRTSSASQTLALGRIWVHLHRALELADTTAGLENVESELAEVKDRVQAILNVQVDSPNLTPERWNAHPGQ